MSDPAPGVGDIVLTIQGFTMTAEVTTLRVRATNLPGAPDDVFATLPTGPKVTKLNASSCDIESTWMFGMAPQDPRGAMRSAITAAALEYVASTSDGHLDVATAGEPL